MPFAIPPVLAPYKSYGLTDHYRVEMKPFMGDILPGFKTPLWGYNGMFPGPTVSVEQGRKAVMRHINNLPARHPVLKYAPWTSVHLHGSASKPQFDGYASDVTNPGQYKDYEYPNTQTARTLWYHDHGVHHTAENVLMGLAAQYHLHDPLERSLPIPHGEFDVPLIVTDAMFQPDGSLLWDNHDESGMFGDVILVNGRPWPLMQVKRRKYRFRLLNASVARSYSWSLDSGEPFTIIGTDAGLMPAPKVVKSFRQGMAERYEVVIDFSKYPVGRRVVLKNASPKNNINYTNTNKVMAFAVVGDDFDPTDNTVPDVLNPANAVMALSDDRGRGARAGWTSYRSNGKFTINGHTWDDVVASGHSLVEGEPGRRRRRDLGDPQPVRWLVPPGAHPPHRLPRPGPQRQATPAARARPQGRGLRRRERDRQGAGPLRGPRQVHDPLPQPRPRGPRHDDAVRGGRPRGR